MIRFNKLIFASAVFVLSPLAFAASPASIQLGGQLFQKSWTHGNPAISSDGLGPLFNATSCVACHNQGGVGGAGDSRFNAKTIGIESIKISGLPVRSDDVVKSMVSTFHPGFVGADGALTNNLPLSHHGGTPRYQKARAAIMSQIDAQFSTEGGPMDPDEVRRATATPILFNNSFDGRVITIRARLFQRNTTPLFGLALIDQIDGRLMDEQVQIQKKHPEISGRPSTLTDGQYGKFGWRGNVDSLLGFVDQACAAEVGLETARKDQPRDPTDRDYRNTAVDIKDSHVIAMRDFIAALPLPTQEIPEDSYEREMAARGEQVFSSIGCAVCHVPNMGPAKGVYSDILLHDMGYESMDLNHAEPYIVRAKPVRKYTTTSETRSVGRGTMPNYYGGTTPISLGVDRKETTSSGSAGSPGRRTQNKGDFSFTAPSEPLSLVSVIPVASATKVERSSTLTDRLGGLTGTFRVSSKSTTIRDDYMRYQFQPTNFNQEWRTPPLWGVRDSAPYMHDGRAETLLEAIAMHDGESAGTRDRFLALPLADRHAIVAFLNTLAAPKNAPKFVAD